MSTDSLGNYQRKLQQLREAYEKDPTENDLRKARYYYRKFFIKPILRGIIPSNNLAWYPNDAISGKVEYIEKLVKILNNEFRVDYFKVDKRREDNAMLAIRYM